MSSLIAASIATLLALGMAGALLDAHRHDDFGYSAAQPAWALGLSLTPTGWLLMELATHWALVLPALFGKTLIALGFAAFLASLLRASGRSRRWFPPLLLAPVAVVFVLSLVHAKLWPTLPMRSGLLSLVCAGYAACAAWVALSDARMPARAALLWVSGAFVSVALVLGLRGLLLLEPASLALVDINEQTLASVMLGFSALAPMAASLGFALAGSNRLLEHYARMAMQDELTGIANRRSFLQAAQQAFEHAAVRHRALAVLMIDVDEFKRVNDQHGHQAGDQLLHSIATMLQSALPPGDLLGRIGGEEFAVVLPGASSNEALGVAETLRSTIAVSCERAPEAAMRVTVSIGCSCRRDSDDSLQSVLARADAAMLQAKRHGRNRVVSDSDPQTDGKPLVLLRSRAGRDAL